MSLFLSFPSFVRVGNRSGLAWCPPSRLPERVRVRCACAAAAPVSCGAWCWWLPVVLHYSPARDRGSCRERGVAKSIGVGVAVSGGGCV